MMENEEQDGRLIRRTKNKTGESRSLESKEQIDYESTDPKSVETLENEPCQDFYKYTCGKYTERANQFAIKKEAVARRIGEYLLKTEFPESKSDQAMKIFFDKCIESRTLKDQNKNPAHEAGNFLSIYQKIKEMGGWPMMGDGKWNANEFNLNKLLVQTAHSTEMPGEIDTGMFSFKVFGARKLRITFNGESNTDENYGTMENFKKLCELNGLSFDGQLFKHSLNKLKSVKKSFRNLILTKPLLTDKYLLRYPELQKHIKEIDFGYVIENVQSSNKKFFGYILKRTTAMNVPPFSDESGLLDFFIQRTSKEDIANWLIHSYFSSAMLKLATFESGPCEYALMHFLPHASLRVFVRNFLKKENMKPVSDLVEDTKQSVIEMFEESDWIHEKTKQTAIRKVKNMEKIIGYPEDMEAQGALDKTFHVSNRTVLDLHFKLQSICFQLKINGSTVPFELLSQIERRMIRLLMAFAASESNFDMGAPMMEPNAFYLRQGNKLMVMASLMEAPFFDISFPNYARIARIGFILGHEIGHGFDNFGKYYDENADERLWLAPEDMTPFDERTMCFVKQYESYNDPYFGKNLNGRRTLRENIADDFAIDVAWRTFKKSNSSSELELPLFWRYDINKLFFKSYALNWCSSHPTHSLEEELKNKHGTPSFRINGVLANFKPFAETFKCPAGSPMNPYQKCDLF
ncbi:hypothetical protein CAEBREN_01869 [Caenorhabditis brenneri]|uniref:Peptidase M13 C-terminal domain-containing protein n=1 Tax=Caenorhabditis brenneri TaxID=135651 RepID=G0P621_CAEBE|nr:hypothetical protein CAEBREN_01869 [Caenorhabditis brenneri]